MNVTGNKVTIITVNFNQPLVTEQLLESIQLYNDHPDISIIVVDNGSAEDPTPRWRGKYPYIRFIRSEINLGFAGGNNLGIREADGAYYFLVNNDTEFTQGLIPQLLNVLQQNPEVAIVSPKIRYYSQPDILQYAGFTPMNYFTARNHCIGQFEKDSGQYDTLTGETAYAHGAAMMLRASAVRDVGLMKENYFLYYEEMDWCDRFKRNGYRIRVNMQALIYHKESVSVGKSSALKEYFMNRNRILFERRNAPFFKRQVFYLYFITIVTPRNLLKYARSNQRGFGRQLLRAIAWNLTHSVDSKETGFRAN